PSHGRPPSTVILALSTAYQVAGSADTATRRQFVMPHTRQIFTNFAHGSNGGFQVVRASVGYWHSHLSSEQGHPGWTAASWPTRAAPTGGMLNERSISAC